MAYRLRSLIAAAGLLCAVSVPALGEETIVVSSTTSTEQSGLFSWILPRFEKDTGIKVHVVAVGTGQAIDIGRRGDADVLLVHDRVAEEKFVAEGFGINRKDVMYNDFVFVGPKDDPAKVKATDKAPAALKAIASSGQAFVSRADKSGTHAAELRLWKAAGVDPKSLAGYKETGSGMGPTLNMAAAINGYTMTDRATWGAFNNRQNLEIVLEGDPVLFNPYSVIELNPARHPHIKAAAAKKFSDWLTSKPGQDAITSFRANGQQVFFLMKK